nr:hypothetical protein CFP56_27380 [Quercus suber]
MSHNSVTVSLPFTSSTLPLSTAALLSLANQFNFMLSVYEFVCKLREVDLKLKLINGLKAQKTLVQETKSHGGGDNV